MREIDIIRPSVGRWRGLYRRVRRWWWVRVCGWNPIIYDCSEMMIRYWRTWARISAEQALPLKDRNINTDLDELDAEFRKCGSVADAVARGLAKDMAKGPDHD
jgi:hypothetical protein